MNPKRLLMTAGLFITGAVGLYFLVFARTRGPHSELQFVKHTNYGATPVAVFRLIPASGEKEFAVIAPYERTPWRLQLTFVQKPPQLLVRLKTSWFLLRTRRTAAFPQIKALWSKPPSIPSFWPALMAQSQFDKPVRQQLIASDLVTNTVAGK